MNYTIMKNFVLNSQTFALSYKNNLKMFVNLMYLVSYEINHGVLEQ